MTDFSSLEQGITAIRQALQTMPASPGVYRMLDKHNSPLYVGKAKNLAKRIVNYTQPERLSARIRLMVSHTASMEVVTTNTEAEALLLEANLIKRLQPRYNILLKDDKSFPYIALTKGHSFSRVMKHRGKKEGGAEYFGPFASAGDVNETIAHLQKIFRLRPCSDDFFASRKRPCLEYQIKRCSGPCVGKISEEDYRELVKQARDFLSGKSQEVQKRLAIQMEEASQQMEYEKAALIRDRIRALTHIQAKQHINLSSLKDADVIGLYRGGDACCIQIFFFRAGQNYGNKSYFPLHTAESSDAEILSAFIGQFYQAHPPPEKIILSHPIEGVSALEQALATLSHATVRLLFPDSGEAHKAVQAAIANAADALRRKLAGVLSEQKLLQGVQALFAIAKPLKRIEVYDNSHIMGQHAIGGMIVAGEEGFIKQAYRRFNMGEEVATKQRTGGDDYAMLRFMLTRRLTRLLEQAPHYTEGVWPDLLLIDGGAGQLNIALDVLKTLHLSSIPCVGIAKGPERNAGREQFFLPGQAPFTLSRDDPVMRYLQVLRDEAHRYAIGSHRKRRAMALTVSALDAIPGIGAKRKKALLNHFGSVKDIQAAQVEDLAKVEGINKITAETLYATLHAEK